MGMDTRKATEEIENVLLVRWRYPTEPDAVDMAISTIAANICEKCGLKLRKCKNQWQKVWPTRDEFPSISRSTGPHHLKLFLPAIEKTMQENGGDDDQAANNRPHAGNFGNNQPDPDGIQDWFQGHDQNGVESAHMADGYAVE